MAQQNKKLLGGSAWKKLSIWCRHCNQLLFEIRTKDKVDTKLEMITATGVKAEFTCKQCGYSERFQADANDRTEW